MSAKRILLVDDDNDLVMSIEAFLTARGYAVSHGRQRQRGLQAHRRETGPTSSCWT